MLLPLLVKSCKSKAYIFSLYTEVQILSFKTTTILETVLASPRFNYSVTLVTVFIRLSAQPRISAHLE